MEGRIRLTARERTMLLQAYRSGADTRIARRGDVVLLRRPEAGPGRSDDRVRETLDSLPCEPSVRVSRIDHPSGVPLFD